MSIALDSILITSAVILLLIALRLRSVATPYVDHVGISLGWIPLSWGNELVRMLASLEKGVYFLA
jgi:hypothetical protein